MEWDERAVGMEIVYVTASTGDWSSPPAVGEVANLSKENHEFEVVITSINDSQYSGTVNTIGPNPVLEAIGIELDQEVEFEYQNIKSIRR